MKETLFILGVAGTLAAAILIVAGVQLDTQVLVAYAKYKKGMITKNTYEAMKAKQVEDVIILINDILWSDV